MRSKPTLPHKVRLFYTYWYTHTLYLSLSAAVVCVSGPTELTVERFWQMVWEQQLPTIVMLTRCVEDGKVSAGYQLSQ